MSPATHCAIPQTAILCLFLFLSSIVDAETLDDDVGIFLGAVRNRDSAQALDGLEKVTFRLNELYGIANKALAPIEQITNTVNLASKAIAQEPNELGEFVEAINKDTDRLNRTQPLTAVFGDPLRGVLARDLQSTDSAVRGRALDTVRQQGGKLRDAYTQKLTQLKGVRGSANTELHAAQAAEQRELQLEKTLDHINSTAAGVFLNIGGGRLAYTLLDLAIDVQPALATRTNAARNLVNRYDRAIGGMEQTLKRYELFDQWAGFYRWQDWARQNFHANGIQAASIQPSNHLQEAEKLMEGANQAAQGLSAAPLPSRGESLIQELTTETIDNTTATKSQADYLLREAAKENQRSATLAEFSALFNLAGAIGGAASQPSEQSRGTDSQSGQQPPLIINNTHIEFKLVPPDITTSPNTGTGVPINPPK